MTSLTLYIKVCTLKIIMQLQLIKNNINAQHKVH